MYDKLEDDKKKIEPHNELFLFLFFIKITTKFKRHQNWKRKYIVEKRQKQKIMKGHIENNIKTKWLILLMTS